MEEKIPKSTDTELNFLNQVGSSPPNNEVTASESNPDPPNSCPLDSSSIEVSDSPLDSSKKKKSSFLKNHWQHLCASLLLMVFFITTSIDLIYVATSVGSGHGQGVATYSPCGNPCFAVTQVVSYMVTPMKLFPYEPVYENASIGGTKGSYAGSKMLIQE